MSATIAVAVKGALSAVQLGQVVLDLSIMTSQFMTLWQRATSEGRSITEEEIAELQRADDEARTAQVAAVDNRKQREDMGDDTV